MLDLWHCTRRWHSPGGRGGDGFPICLLLHPHTKHGCTTKCTAHCATQCLFCVPKVNRCRQQQQQQKQHQKFWRPAGFFQGTSVVIMPHDQQSAVACVCVEVSVCVLCICACVCTCVCNGKNSACPLAMCVFLIQKFLHVYICEYVFMFQSVCTLRVCTYMARHVRGKNHWREHVAGEDKSQGVGMRGGERLEEKEEKEGVKENDMTRGDGEDNRRKTQHEISTVKRCLETKREEREEKKLRNKSLSRRDLASHPPTITAPHVRHCEGRENKNDKEMEKEKKKKRNKVEISTLYWGKMRDFRGPSGQRSQSSNIVKWNVCGVE